MDNEVNCYEVFGLEAPADDPAQTGAQAQEPADPADSTGAQAQDPADPAADVDDDADGEEGREADSTAGKKPLTKEQRAENAQRRRKKEIDDAVAAAVEKERKANNARFERFLKTAKIRNKYQGNAEIQNVEQAEAWAEAHQQAELEENLKAGRLKPNDLQKIVEQSPTVKAMQAKLDAAEQAEKNQKTEQFERTAEAELAEIRKYNPRINSLTDILSMETGKAFFQCINRGMTYLEAYRQANWEQILAQERSVARTAGQINTGGKDHMRRDQARGAGAAQIPGDVLQAAKAMMPNATEDEIQAYYAKTMK